VSEREEQVVINSVRVWQGELLKYVESFMRALNEIESITDEGDRITLIMKISGLLAIVKYVIEDFANWIRAPQVQAVISEDLLRELLAQAKSLAKQALMMDAEHTSKFAELLNNLTPQQMELLKLIYRTQTQQRGQVEQPQQEQQHEAPRYI